MAKTITIRHVPDEVRNELAARAARAGQSLQEFMLGEVTRLASKPSMDELIARIRDDKRQAGTVIDRESVLADLHADRR
jgi:hypothetical protein